VSLFHVDEPVSDGILEEVRELPEVLSAALLRL